MRRQFTPDDPIEEEFVRLIGSDFAGGLFFFDGTRRWYRRRFSPESHTSYEFITNIQIFSRALVFSLVDVNWVGGVGQSVATIA